MKFPLYLLALPSLYLLFYFLSINATGPFYLTRIDPDYVYLLNGMNCAVFNFDRIGHVDHPGTPFQLFIGICIRLLYTFSSTDQSLIEDVLLRPEHYLKYTSHILAVLFTLLLVWSGKIGIKRGILPALLLQATPFLSAVIPDLSVRMMPDRFGFILVFLIALLCIRQLENEKMSSIKDIIWLGLLTGLAVATKIIFIPVLFIPLLVLRKRLLFVIFSVLGFMLGIAPIFNQFRAFRVFIDKIATHDGIYGQGENQFVDLHQFSQNLYHLISLNPLLYLIFAATVLMLLGSRNSFSGKTSYRQLMIGLSLAVLFSTLMVAKHFKNYYLIGALVLGGVGLYALYILFERKFLKSLLVGLSIFFSIHTIYNLVKSPRFKKEILTTRLQDQNGLRQAMQKADFLLFKPEWMWGPSPDYGLIFGLSYVRHRDRYKEIIHGIKPEVLTFEGNDRSLMNMRVLNIPDTALVDKTIVTVDQSVRPAKEILDFLHARLEIIGVDSIYGTPETPIICIRTGKSISPIQ